MYFSGGTCFQTETPLIRNQGIPAAPISLSTDLAVLITIWQFPNCIYWTYNRFCNAKQKIPTYATQMSDLFLFWGIEALFPFFFFSLHHQDMLQSPFNTLMFIIQTRQSNLNQNSILVHWLKENTAGTM